MKINIGDTVKIIGKTDIGDHEEELITIGTVCRVVSVENGDIAVIPESAMPYKGFGEYWYSCDVVKKALWI